jgi:prephenate dehydrogenase
MFKRVGILGTGLIGGSVGCALKKHGLARTVVGVSRRPESIRLAIAMKAIDSGSTDLSVLAGADLLILATPVEKILGLGPQLTGLISPACIVIDVGSTKELIVRKLSKVFKRFVGTHPLAGSEKRGVAYASASLLKGAQCIITPGPASDKGAVSRVSAMYRAIGAKTVTLSGREHDAVLALTSHLPHLIAFALMNSLPKRYAAFVPASFRDLTRIAASDAGIWDDIFSTNAGNIRAWLDVFLRELERIGKTLKKNDRKALQKMLERASRQRNALK